jgi:hypothetical protein
MGLYTGSLANYYGGIEEQGGYQFISITDVINNFRVGYVGEDKIIAKISRADIRFHAMRGLQELSFDTLKSCKSLELMVPPSLLLPIPHDYVNYIKLTWTDANGKCHTINSCRDCFKDPLSYKQREDGTVDVGEGKEPTKVRVLCTDPYANNYDATANSDDGSCCFEKGCGRSSSNNHYRFSNQQGGEGRPCDPTNPKHWEIWHPAVYEWIEVPGSFDSDPIEINSTTWTNNSGAASGGSAGDANFSLNTGGRYGLDGKHANINGTYWINCRTGKIHFSSNLAGKTVILEYISDHLGTDDEMRVHKFAEEAMYKHIAHAILNTRAGMDRNIVATFKKERFAAVRSAKLRLSSIKLSEITQILRGKSKWIKH